jgi:hypothetical protein
MLKKISLCFFYSFHLWPVARNNRFQEVHEMRQLGMRSLFLLQIILLAGCGAPAGNAAPTADAPMSETSADVGADVAEAPGEDVAFADMAFGERKAFMADVVMPEMKPLFVEQHPAFACVSCHGENMSEVNY